MLVIETGVKVESPALDAEMVVPFALQVVSPVALDPTHFIEKSCAAQFTAPLSVSVQVALTEQVGKVLTVELAPHFVTQAAEEEFQQPFETIPDVLEVSPVKKSNVT